MRKRLLALHAPAMLSIVVTLSTLIQIVALSSPRLSRYSLQAIPEHMIPGRATTYAPMTLLVLILPIGVLVGLVLARYTVQYAVLWAILIALAIFIVKGLWPTRDEAPANRRTRPAAVRVASSLGGAFERAAHASAAPRRARHAPSSPKAASSLSRGSSRRCRPALPACRAGA